jgi:hypothetical protein
VAAPSRRDGDEEVAPRSCPVVRQPGEAIHISPPLSKHEVVDNSDRRYRGTETTTGFLRQVEPSTGIQSNEFGLTTTRISRARIGGDV